MIAFGSSITMPEIYERCAAPGIRRAAERDSVVFAHAAAGSISRSYNLILDEATALEDLEAVVLVHQDAEIADPELATLIRSTLQDPDVGVVGCVGARGVSSMAWWEGEIVQGPAVFRYGELGGGELPVAGWRGVRGTAPGEVDTVAGFCLVLSPWVVRSIRFDESLGLEHGYDFDLCRQVRAAGRKVIVANLDVVHHHALELVHDAETWMEAHVQVAGKWDDGAEADDKAWRRRARRLPPAAGLRPCTGAQGPARLHG
jgi:Glycosyltransferase like family